MNDGKGSSMKSPLLAASAMLAMFAFGPCANASPVRINFSGATGSGYVDLTLAPDPDANAMYQPAYSQSDASHVPPISPPLSPYDPVGAQHIIGASGMFSQGANHFSITGVIPTSPGVAPPGETLPKSFSWLTAGGNSYDNLFYANGSPLVCPPIGDDPYIFYGGFLDIFGAMFALDNGGVVGLWSDGVMPTGLTYGLSVFDPVTGGGYTQISDQFAGVTAAVPEPGFLWLFGAGVLGLFAWRRSAESRKALGSR